LGMSWVVEMAGMPADLLREVTGASDDATRQMLRRWRTAGWAESRKLDAGPIWVWATRDGIALFGRHQYDYRIPSVAKLAHHRGVILARQRLEKAAEEKGQNPQWRSEREIRWEVSQERRSAAVREHFVDGSLDYDAADGMRMQVGVEVELSAKPREVLRRNMNNGLDTRSGGFRQVIWFVNDRTRALVAGAREELGDAKDRIVIREVET
jgi:hypothetical protein